MPARAATVLPPGPREPAALQTLEWIMRPTAFLRRCEARHGSAFTLRLTFDDAPVVVLSDHAAIRAVFAAPDVARRGLSQGVLAPVVGPRSISVLDGPEHLRVRRLLLAPFHGEALARRRAALAEVAERHVAALPAGEPVALLPQFGALTLDAILRVVLGAGDPALAGHARAALAHVRALPRAAALSLAPPSAAVWRPFLRHVRAAEGRIARIVAARRAEGGGGDDVLAALLAAGCDDEEIRDHVLTLVAAGHDTTTASLAWAAERLARHPGWQERPEGGEVTVTPPSAARGSQGTVPSVPSGSQGTVPSVPSGVAGRTATDVLDAIVKETLRVRPVLTVAPRRLVAPLDVGGLVLPAGVHAAPCLYLAARRPAEFDPGRWLRDEAPAWWPFGGGTRRCTGAAFAQVEMAETLRALLDRFTLRPEPGHERGERPRRRGVTLQPARGARVILEART